MAEDQSVRAEKMKAVACQSFHLDIEKKAAHLLEKVKGSTVESSESWRCAAAAAQAPQALYAKCVHPTSGQLRSWDRIILCRIPIWAYLAG